jgi:hypothetical protein
VGFRDATLRALPIAGLLTCGVFLLISDFVWYRHNLVRNAHACHVRQIVRFPQDSAFILLGSSRVRRGIDPKEVEAASGGVLRHGMNLARPSNGIARNFSILQDVYARQAKPRVVFLEIDLDSLTAASAAESIRTYKVGRFSPVRQSNYLLEFTALDWFPDPVRLLAVAQLYTYRLGYLITILFDGKLLESLRQLQRPASDICWLRMFGPRRLTPHEAARTTSVPVGAAPSTPTSPRLRDDWALHRELVYLREIRSLVGKHGGVLVISRVPKRSDGPLTQSSLARIHSVIPEFIYPPADLLTRLAPFYKDSRHFDAVARQQYSRWLAGVLVERSDGRIP